MSRKRPKYMPDIAKVLEACDPALMEERERKALAPLVEAGLIDRLTPEPAARTSAPSPWAAKAEEGEIDREALPSAMGPAAPAAPAEERPVTKRAAPVKAVKPQWTRSWKLAIGFLLVGAAMPGLVVLAGRSREAREKAAAGSPSPSATAIPMATSTDAVLPNATAIPMATAEATAAPSATAAAGPSATADGGARRQVGAGGREPPPPEDDPYDEPKRSPAKSKQPPMIF